MSAREDLRKKVDAEASQFYSALRFPFFYVELRYQGLVGVGFAKWNLADADDPDHPWNPDMGYRIARGRAVAEIIKQMRGEPVRLDEAPDYIVRRMQKAKLRAEKRDDTTLAHVVDMLGSLKRLVANGLLYGTAPSDVKAGDLVGVTTNTVAK